MTLSFETTKQSQGSPDGLYVTVVVTIYSLVIKKYREAHCLMNFLRQKED
jgi:hypothetical protein